MYVVGHSYTRKDIFETLGLPSEQVRGGNWFTGYNRHEDDFYVFCNVGVAGRTGHDYDNHWEGEKLVWYGKSGTHYGQKAVRDMLSGECRVLVFYREDERSAFLFAGVGRPVPHPGVERPVRIDWVFSSDDLGLTATSTDEYLDGAVFREGQRTRVWVNRYERDRSARDACLRHHGSICSVCNFSFPDVYGDIGEGFIHVHHIVPVSHVGESYAVDPLNDLVPVCPNCHAMIHRRNPPFSVEEMKALVGVV